MMQVFPILITGLLAFGTGDASSHNFPSSTAQTPVLLDKAKLRSPLAHNAAHRLFLVARYVDLDDVDNNVAPFRLAPDNIIPQRILLSPQTEIQQNGGFSPLTNGGFPPITNGGFSPITNAEFTPSTIGGQSNYFSQLVTQSAAETGGPKSTFSNTENLAMFFKHGNGETFQGINGPPKNVILENSQGTAEIYPQVTAQGKNPKSLFVLLPQKNLNTLQIQPSKEVSLKPVDIPFGQRVSPKVVVPFRGARPVSPVALRLVPSSESGIGTSFFDDLLDGNPLRGFVRYFSRGLGASVTYVLPITAKPPHQ